MATTWIERQGKRGDRKLVRVRNRFGGSRGHGDEKLEESEDRLRRRSIRLRDDRLIDRQSDSPIVKGNGDDDIDGLFVDTLGLDWDSDILVFPGSDGKLAAACMLD